MAKTSQTVKVKQDENQHQVRYGDVLFTGSSEIAEEVGMSSSVTYEPTEPTYLNSFSFGLRFNADVELCPEFTKHLFRSEEIRKQIKHTASGVTCFNVSKAIFKKILIPIPPLEEQRRIVDILDRFETLVHSITEGWPREIELRQKQYEYYRDQLLTFTR